MSHRHRRKSHKAAIAGRIGIRRAREWFAGLLPTSQRLPGGDADIETRPVAGIGAILMPADKPRHQIGLVQSRIGDEAVGQGESHGRIIGPFSRFLSEWATPDHVGQQRIAVSALDLERRADRIADRQSEPRTGSAIPDRLGFGRPLTLIHL